MGGAEGGSLRGARPIISEGDMLARLACSKRRRRRRCHHDSGWRHCRAVTVTGTVDRRRDAAATRRAVPRPGRAQMMTSNRVRVTGNF